MKRSHFAAALTSVVVATSLGHASAMAQDSINIYSARHYQSDEALYAGFTKATGIAINRVDADDAGILARLKAEGKASPADVILLVDATRLHSAEHSGLFQRTDSSLLNKRIPAHLRSPGNTWFGFSTRARVIVYDPKRVKASDVATYEQLGAPVNKGKVCVRTGTHPYNLSLFGAMAVHNGDAATQTWLSQVASNLARKPQGGDTDQMRAVASGECAIAVANSYYLARLMRSDKPADQAVVAALGVVMPNQATTGTHMNVAGGAVAANAPHKAGAVRFLEYLASDAAQAHFANGNNEWPAVPGVAMTNTALNAMTANGFKTDTTPIADIGAKQVAVQQMLDRVGFR
jgi:iron(III) transport system substrate-binding protein